MVALLQYVVNQLKSSESLDLLVLKEMVQTMTVRAQSATGRAAARPARLCRCKAAAVLDGCTVACPAATLCATHTPARLPAVPPACLQGHQAVFDVSEFQLDALAGSDTLKAEVITQGEHRSSDKSLQRASGRLLAALMQGDTPAERLAMPLLVLLAQQRKLIVLQSQVRRRT